MTKGYLYCLSNVSMPGLLKIGMSSIQPEELVKEANSFNEWGPPGKYKCNFAKKVNNASQKIKTLHLLLDTTKKRYVIDKEFFKISKSEVLTYFDLMDGKMWEKSEDQDMIDPGVIHYPESENIDMDNQEEYDEETEEGEEGEEDEEDEGEEE